MSSRFPLPPECRYAVIGDPVEHSRSPRFQNAAFAALGLGRPYAKIRVTAAEIPEFLEFARDRLAGFNITVPHKERILPLLDAVSETARAAGSVNTVTVRPDRTLAGDSTDGCGMIRTLEECFTPSIAGWGYALIGAGGAARAIAFALASAGARELLIVNRGRERAETLAAELKRQYPALWCSVWSPEDPELGDALAAAAVTIQATSLGLRRDDPLPVPEAALIRSRAVCDTIYGDTPTLRAARTYDIPAVDGTPMLLYQGARAFEIWTGLSAPVEVMRAALIEA